jgi:hypothetical protein
MILITALVICFFGAISALIGWDWLESKCKKSLETIK